MTAAGRSQPGTQRTFLLSLFLNNLRTQIQALISSLTGGLLAGRKVELAALRERVVTRGGNSLLAQLQAQILAAIQTAITNFLNSLGINLGRKINLAETERQLLTSTEMDLILAEMGFSGGIEELAQIIQSEMAALFAQMEEMEQLSDEEVFQHVME